MWCVRACTCRPHVYEGVVDEDQLVEVELVGKALAFSFVQDPFVVVIPAGQHKHTPLRSVRSHKTHAPSDRLRTAVIILVQIYINLLLTFSFLNPFYTIPFSLQLPIYELFSPPPALYITSSIPCCSIYLYMSLNVS